MTKADANRVGLAYVEETAYGVGGGAQTLQNVRFTGESFSQANSTVISQELRSDRQVADLLRTDVQCSGGFNFELSLGTTTEVAFNDLFKSVVGSAGWSSQTEHMAADATIEVEVVAATSTLEAQSGTPFSSIAVGDWIIVGGTTTSTANTGAFKVTAQSGGTLLTVEPTGVLANQTISANGVAANCTVNECAMVTDGTTSPEPYYFERSYADLATFAGFYGASPSNHTLNAEPGAIVTGAFDFMGKLGDSLAATEGDGSNTASGTTDVCSSVDHVEWVMEGSTVYACTAYNHAMTPNLRARQVIGTLGAESIGQGTIGVTGGHTAFYEDATRIDKHIDMTSSNVAICFKDNDGHYLVFDFPRVKYSDGKRVGGGINQDVLAEMQWTAIRDATETHTVRIAKFAAS